MIIRGNTVGTTMPRADYGETDPKSAVYIKNKPDEAIQKAQKTADNAQTLRIMRRVRQMMHCPRLAVP